MMPFDQYLILRNPISTDAHKAIERITELQQLYPNSKVTVVDTQPGGRETNARILRQQVDVLGPRTLLCIAAGDGTINLIIDILLNDQSLPAEARMTPILPLWCGNANDLAHMLNGRSSRISFKRLLEDGHVVAIHPLRCQLTNTETDTTRTHIAACYASFGASAFAARELERTMRRKSPMRQAAATRIGQELVAVSRALLHAPRFTINDESGQTKVIFERIFLNGSRFAKVTGVPLRLTDTRFHRTTIEQKSLSAVVFHIIELTRYRKDGRTLTTHDTFTIHDPVWAQFDGEAMRIPPQTNVEVTIDKQPFYALSTQLNGKG